MSSAKKNLRHITNNHDTYKQRQDPIKDRTFIQSIDNIDTNEEGGGGLGP